MMSPHAPVRFWRSVVSTACLILMPAHVSWAYNPPVDSDGPLTVRIAGPESVSELEEPFALQVVIGNTAQQPITGKLQLKVIDRWRCEPGEAIPFAVPAAGEAVYEFQVVAGEGSYAAHYPIHALATFDWEGQPRTVHPVLILETKISPSKRATVPLEWQPLRLTNDRSLALGQVPVYRAVMQVFGSPAQTKPVGFIGSDPTHHGSVDVSRPVRLEGVERQALAIHPPWYEGQVGTAWIEYPLALPEATPIKLRFATAVTPTGTGDGVTFRVRVAPLDAPAGELGEIAFERHSAAKSWEAGEADLSRFAGRQVRLQLESHPGPANNTSFDQSYWAEPTLIIGSPPSPAPFPPASPAGSRLLGTVRSGTTPYRIHLWSGRRGLLDAVVHVSGDDGDLYFRGFRVRVLGERIDDPASPTALVAAIAEPSSDAAHQVRHRFAGLHGTFDLVGRISVEDEALRVKFWLENAPPPRPWFAPRIEELSVDEFHVQARRVYAGHGNVIEGSEAFQLSFDGHRLATSHVGFDFPGGMSLVQAVDLPPDALEVDPESRHYSLHAVGESTLTFLPAGSVWEAVRQYRKINGLQPAGGVRRLAGRFVFDLWGGRYGESGEQLERAFRYGLTDAAVVWHNWQRWGYDYRLPEIYPPNPQWGTEDELKRMLGACREAGVLIALHDNYIDMYPDADGFSYETNIAFHEGGGPVKAWLNEGRDARSYRYRADRIEPFLRGNLAVIADRLRPTAYFIDVWSSARPYDYWTADGRFFDRVFTRDTWGRQFAWIRELLGDDAPQISESGHDQLIGSLDGAQTNHLRVGPPLPGNRGWCVWNIRCDDAERIPWFDAAHHDRFVLHGAGYPSRYEGGLDGRLHGMYSDDYTCTEVLTGHPVMVNRPFGRDVVRKYWLSQDLMRALALRTIEDVTFVDGDLHRQYVRWSGGGQVWVNRGETDWHVGDRTLPPYGFFAQVPSAAGTVTASIERRDRIVVEQASSPQHVYVNGRQVVGGPKRIRAAVVKAESKGLRRLDLDIAWQADEAIPDGYRPFIHFVATDGEIAFQANYDPKPLSEQRRGRIVMPAVAEVPDAIAAGTAFDVRVGLYHPAGGGPRLAILGSDDGETRYRLGSITLDGEGADVTGIRWTPCATRPDPVATRQNSDAKPVDFGPLVTAGGCRVLRQGDSVLVVPLPDSGTVGSEFELRWSELPWELPRPTHIETVGEDGRVRSRRPADDPIRMVCEPEAFAYRLTSAGPK